MKKDEIYYGITETARKLGISPDVLRIELHDGKIEGHLRGKRTKFRQGDIDKYIEKQTINNAALSMADYKPTYIKKIPGIKPFKRWK